MMDNAEQNIVLETQALEHQGTRVLTCLLADDGVFPNNALLPLIVYKHVLEDVGDRAIEFARRFAERGWSDRWRDGLYPVHHYHSTAHEVWGFASGMARIQFGGPRGVFLELEAGDAVIIPAGVSHMNETNSSDLLVVGAYPDGCFPDILSPDEGDFDGNDSEDDDRIASIERIAALEVPEKDPLFGSRGLMRQLWKKAR